MTKILVYDDEARFIHLLAEMNDTSEAAIVELLLKYKGELVRDNNLKDIDEQKNE